MEEEVRDVVSEANAYTPNWGQTIFQSANEMMNNEIYRQRIKEHEDKLAEERAWWEKKRANTQEVFMKELNEDETSTQTQAEAQTPAKDAGTATPVKAAGSVQGSDDDAVMVEADPSAGNQASPGGGGGGKKKKGKGKK